jgi:hypothetical protein
VPPLAIVSTIAFFPPGSGMQIAPSTSAGEIRYASPETDCEAGTVSRELLTVARAAAELQASDTTAAGTASTASASQMQPQSPGDGAPSIR